MKSLAVLLLMLGLAAPAFAYVDPGTGMLAIQGLVALVIGVLAFVRHPIQTIRRAWRRWSSRRNDDA